MAVQELRKSYTQKNMHGVVARFFQSKGRRGEGGVGYSGFLFIQSPELIGSRVHVMDLWGKIRKASTQTDMREESSLRP